MASKASKYSMFSLTYKTRFHAFDNCNKIHTTTKHTTPYNTKKPNEQQLIT